MRKIKSQEKEKRFDIRELVCIGKEFIYSAQEGEKYQINLKFNSWSLNLEIPMQGLKLNTLSFAEKQISLSLAYEAMFLNFEFQTCKKFKFYRKHNWPTRKG